MTGIGGVGVYYIIASLMGYVIGWGAAWTMNRLGKDIFWRKI